MLGSVQSSGPRFAGSVHMGVATSNPATQMLRFEGTGDKATDKVVPKRSRLKRYVRNLMFSLAGAAMLYGGLGKVLTPVTLKEPPRVVTENIGWADNVKVIASTGEDQYAHYDYIFNHFFTNALLDQLKRKAIHTLDEASQALLDKGYASFPFTRQYPVETPRKLAGWDKRETDRPRYVVILSQPESQSMYEKSPFHAFHARQSDRVREADLNRVKNTLQEQYQIPEENIRVIQDMKTSGPNDDVRQSFDWLKEELRENPGADVLIYYVGHGYAYGQDREADTHGDATGTFAGLYEGRLKRLTSQLTSANSVYILLDTCYSGSWVGY